MQNTFDISELHIKHYQKWHVESKHSKQAVLQHFWLQQLHCIVNSQSGSDDSWECLPTDSTFTPTAIGGYLCHPGSVHYVMSIEIHMCSYYDNIRIIVAFKKIRMKAKGTQLS